MNLRFVPLQAHVSSVIIGSHVSLSLYRMESHCSMSGMMHDRNSS